MINGQRVGDQFLTPGWTSYNKKLQYQTYDVSKLLNQGANAAGAVLGDGWYRGHLAWQNNRNLYGKTLGVLFQLEVEYTDRTKETINSNESWNCSTGPVTKSSIYYGEAYPARMEQGRWVQAEFNDESWKTVTALNGRKEHWWLPRTTHKHRIIF